MVDLRKATASQGGQNRRSAAASEPGSPAQVTPRRVGLLGVHTLVIVLCLLTLFPLLWTFSTAFKDPQEVFAPGINLLPEQPTLRNFPAAFELAPVGRWFLNTAIVAVATTVGKLLISIPAAYAFARQRFFGRNVLFALVVGTMAVPYVITIVPNYAFVARFGLLNTLPGVIIPSIAFTGFYVFLLRQAMLVIPQELIDAARVDGAGTLTILFQIILPLIRPTLVVVAVLSFLWGWNLYLWPLLVLSDLDSRTLSVGMQYFIASSDGNPQWGPLMATATLAILPPILLYLFAQKAIISAFVESGVKG